MTQRGDWIKFSCGDKVYDLDDARHIGRIEAILSGCLARVRWDETGWNSYVPISRLSRSNV